MLKTTTIILEKREKVRRKTTTLRENSATKSSPALTPEAREQQLIALAVDVAEQQLRDGTASAQVITHYLKLGASNYKLEQEKRKLENELTKAKTKAIESSENSERIYSDAINAFQIYSGKRDD